MTEQITRIIDDWALDSFRTYSDERLNDLRNLFRNDRILALLDHNRKAADGLLIFQHLVEQVQAERRDRQAPSPDTPL
jgi:hypothetical protein